MFLKAGGRGQGGSTVESIQMPTWGLNYGEPESLGVCAGGLGFLGSSSTGNAALWASL